VINTKPALEAPFIDPELLVVYRLAAFIPSFQLEPVIDAASDNGGPISDY